MTNEADKLSESRQTGGEMEADEMEAGEMEAGGIGSGSGSGGGTAKRKYGSSKGGEDSKLLVTKDKKVRHSQACDRCRLKKIKCDGLKPTCSNCLKVNYKCCTSDRLTRRGFPRGYTEMLEKEVVRLQKLVSGGAGVEEVADGGAEAGGAIASTKPAESGRGPQLPFINDTFHRYNNYRCGESFLGHCTWDVLLKHHVGDNNNFVDESWLDECNLFMIVNALHIDHQNSFLPKFLIFKYKRDFKKLGKLITKAIVHFNKFQNSLVPLLQPFEHWKNQFNKILNSSSQHQHPDPLFLLALIYIIQLYWSCFDDCKLFQLTKIICSSGKSTLDQLQLLLLSCFYFMGGLTSNKPNSIHKIWSTELLHLSFAKVIDLGLFINSNRLVPVNSSKEVNGIIGSDHEKRLISFWSFQFLDSLSSLFQGTPKINFLNDEFHPQSIKSLHTSIGNSFLKPFSLISDLIVNSLDGCNLLHVLSNSSSGRSQLIYATECFRKTLKKLKLYHHLQDHENEFDNEFLPISLSLTKPDVVEIQLTLFYLLVSFIIANGTTEENEQPTNLEDIAHEILSLYYLLMIDESHLGQPSQLCILHIFPCNNNELILNCIEVLNNWVKSPQNQTNQMDNQHNWKSSKYKALLTQWCRLYYYDDPSNPVLQQTISHYKIDLEKSDDLPPTVTDWNMVDYLNRVVQFNSLNDLNKRSNLIRSNSNAVMDTNPFDMFSHSNSLKHMFEIPQDNNIIDISAFKSQILLPNQESDDDGYAEDDDEDDEDIECKNNYDGGDDEGTKPLEIPFRTKRAGSLFQDKHNLPPSYRNDCRPINSKETPDSTQSSSHGKRRTLDHIILGNKSFVSQNEEAPPAKIQHLNNDKPFSHSYNDYSLIQPTKKMITTGSCESGTGAGSCGSAGGCGSTAINSEGIILPSPPPPNNDPLMFNKGPIGHLYAENSKNTPQIVETPRAFVDMLLLRSPSHSRDLAKSSSNKQEVTSCSKYSKDSSYL